MNLAYLDTSCLVAMALGEPGHERVAGRLRDFDQLVASALLEAEYLAALARDNVPPPDDPFRDLRWIHPQRRLTSEIEQALEAGHTRGADLWHVACALLFRDQGGELTFLTLDQRQAELAAALGFST